MTIHEIVSRCLECDRIGKPDSAFCPNCGDITRHQLTVIPEYKHPLMRRWSDGKMRAVGECMGPYYCKADDSGVFEHGGVIPEGVVF